MHNNVIRQQAEDYISISEFSYKSTTMSLWMPEAPLARTDVAASVPEVFQFGFRPEIVLKMWIQNVHNYYNCNCYQKRFEEDDHEPPRPKLLIWPCIALCPLPQAWDLQVHRCSSLQGPNTNCTQPFLSGLLDFTTTLPRRSRLQTMSALLSHFSKLTLLFDFTLCWDAFVCVFLMVFCFMWKQFVTLIWKVHIHKVYSL